MRAEDIRDVAGEPVRAVVAAQQGHDATPVLRYGNHRRLGALVREVRGEDADEDAGGADADDGRARAEQRREMGGQTFVCDVGGAFQRLGAVDRSSRQQARDAPCEEHLARIEDGHCGPAQFHAAPRLWTTIMEK